ncbi:hypothetical protein [Sphingobium yanoikuyae]|uniref:hypothetical protein n=1 Tax=Sphingobium yanoikuyae TaxID=13690 RepID=UPI00345EDE0F
MPAANPAQTNRSNRANVANLAAQIAGWRHGSAGFFRFVEEAQPRVPGDGGEHVPFQLDDTIRQHVRDTLDNPEIAVACFSYPRRHGKTALTAMLIAWRFITRINENIAVVANSEKQVASTALRLIKGAFEHTPILRQLVGAGHIVIGADSITFPTTGSIIKGYSSNPAALWGVKLTAAQISEIHAAKDGGDPVYEALIGSLLDSAGSLMLIDSTVSPRSSKLYELYQLANHPTDPDPSIMFAHIQYADIDESIAKMPPWISATKLRSLKRTMLPHKFALLHLNRWGDAAGALFPNDVLDQCIAEYPLDLAALTNGAASVVGIGLDRAFGGSAHGDKTATAAVAKIMVEGDEHIYILDSDDVFLSRLSAIKKRFESYHRAYNVQRAGIESYGGQDVADWAATQAYADGTETIHPTRQAKYSAFMLLWQAAAEGRLHIHPKFKPLIEEMRVFEVIEDGKSDTGSGQASIPKFSHPRGGHDDYLHALVWAVYSMRTVTMNAYEVEGIHCGGRGPAVVQCALNGGGVIPPCAVACRSMREVQELHAKYLAIKHPGSERLTLPAFIAEKVTNTGAHSLPR